MAGGGCCRAGNGGVIELTACWACEGMDVAEMGVGREGEGVAEATVLVGAVAGISYF